jgi:glycosyltransferase involved in cell wall biosynthesis
MQSDVEEDISDGNADLRMSMDMERHLNPKSQIAAILMLKNENRFILNEDGSPPPYTMLGQCLRRLESLVGHILVVDNGSTDCSRGLYQRYVDNVVYNDPNLPFDDVRDRRRLLAMAKNTGAKWMLVVDGDEVLEDKATDYIHSLVEVYDEMENTDNIAVHFEYINLWRSRTRYRTDAWSNIWFPRLFTTNRLELDGTALHNYHFRFSSGKTQMLRPDVKVLHYGWADWQHRLAKRQRYIKRHAELHGMSIEQATPIYNPEIDETGLTLAIAKPEWNEEFRK